MPLPAAIAIGGLAINAVGSIAQAISGASRTSKAKRALENYQRQELRNITEGMRVSTLGAELQTQEAQRRFSTSVEALRSGGVRGLVGGLQGQERAMQDFQRKIAADLDRQAREIGLLGAQDQARIRAMQEQRESAEIAGLGAEVAAGRQLTQAGIKGLMDTGLSASMMASDGVFDGLGKGKGSDQLFTDVEEKYGFGSFKSSVDPNVRIKNINIGSLYGGGLNKSFTTPVDDSYYGAS